MSAITPAIAPPTQDHLPQLHRPRNPGMALDLDWVARVQANTSAIERSANTLPGRRTVKKAYQAAWLARAITLIDLTTLAGDDTEGRVRRLCAKARQPVRADLLGGKKLMGALMGMNHFPVDLPRLVDFYLRGLLDLDTIIAERIPLEAVNEGFNTMRAGHSARTVVVFD